METQVETDSRVVQALEQALELGEIGIQVAAYLGNELVVDASAGVADQDTGRPVDSSTLFAVFSVTKAVTATALHLQAERGLIDYGAPVATYWPEFAANRKGKITVRQVLSHQAGIPWMPDGVTPARQADWHWMISGIEEMEPAFEAGANCYHALIWGWIIGELVRRTDPQHRDFGQFVAQELLAPLGIDDLYLGVPASEDARVAKLVGGGAPDKPPSPSFFAGMPPAVFPSASVNNMEICRRAINPGAGAIVNARSTARFFAMLANRGELDGIRLLSEDRVLSFLELREGSNRVDEYMQVPILVGTSGYWLGGNWASASPVIGPNTNILQHPGAGGSVAWAELDTGLSVAICHNHMQSYLDPERHPFVPIAKAIRAVGAERALVKHKNDG